MLRTIMHYLKSKDFFSDNIHDAIYKSTVTFKLKSLNLDLLNFISEGYMRVFEYLRDVLRKKKMVLRKAYYY